MLARIKSARGQRAVCLPHHPTLCFFSVPSPPFYFLPLLLFLSVMSESPQSITNSSSSSFGASGQTPGQRLTYFIRLSWRRDRSNTTRVDREEEDRGGELGRRGSANPPAPSVCHIPLLCISSGEQKQQAMQKQMLR